MEFSKELLTPPPSKKRDFMKHIVEQQMISIDLKDSTTGDVIKGIGRFDESLLNITEGLVVNETDSRRLAFVDNFDRHVRRLQKRVLQADGDEE